MITISWSALLSICAAVVALSGAIGAIVRLIKWLKRPGEKQDENISSLERRMDDVEQKLTKNKGRLSDVEKGLRLTLESLLALMSHAIDGNDIDKLKKAKDDLNAYLLEKVEQ